MSSLNMIFLLILSLIASFPLKSDAFTGLMRRSITRQSFTSKVVTTDKQIDQKVSIKPLSSNTVVNYDKKTFRRFAQVELYRTSELEKLFPILCSLEKACRDISKLMRRIATDSLSGNHQLLGSEQSVNIQGETQKKLDVVANRILKIALCCSGEVSVVASEEEDIPCACSEVTDNGAFSGGEYAVVFDPLDGSSNIDSGLPTGTIFGIYRNPRYGPIDPLTTSKQRGSELLVSGYCLYSASTHLVITMRNGVHMFTLDDVNDEFYLTRSNIQVPSHGPVYSFNDVHESKWHEGVGNFYRDLKSGHLKTFSDPSSDDGAPIKKKKAPRTSRYFGALVADVHNILFHGGIYGYPGTTSSPKGKLRLLYEANPIALLMEQANGMATNGVQRILDLPVKDIHDRTPLFVGSRDEVSSLAQYLQQPQESLE